MQQKTNVFINIQNLLRKNSLCIKLYSILQWHERIHAIKRFLYLDKQMKKNNFVLTLKNGTKIYLPYYKTDLIQNEIAFSKNFYEVRTLDSLLDEKNLSIIKKGSFLDIGSNIGNHTLFFFQRGYIQFAYCFEPVQDTFQILQKNISLNNLQNKTKLFNVGVGEKQGKAQIQSYNINNTGLSQLKPCDEGEVPIIAIDDIAFEENISFVKIDVEGFELNVIKGMLNTIKKYKPVIFIEIRNHFFDQIYDYLKLFGYTYMKLDDDGSNYDINNYLFFITDSNQK